MKRIILPLSLFSIFACQALTSYHGNESSAYVYHCERGGEDEGTDMCMTLLYGERINEPYAITVTRITPALLAACQHDDNCMDIDTVEIPVTMAKRQEKEGL